MAPADHEPAGAESDPANARVACAQRRRRGIASRRSLVLPESSASRTVFAEQAVEIRAGAGSAHILTVQADSSEQHRMFMALFDRTADYQELRTRIQASKKNLAKLSELEARKSLAALARDLATTAAIDFFSGKVPSSGTK